MRTLFLANEDFRSRDAGSRVRDWYSAQALASLGDVAVLCFTPGRTIDARYDIAGVEFFLDDPVKGTIALARAARRNTMYHVERYNFGAHRAAPLVRERSFDVVFASMMYGIPYIDHLVGRDDPPPKVMWDTQNFDPDTWKARMNVGSLSHRAFARMMLPRAQALASRSMRAVDAAIVCTVDDRTAWGAIAGDTDVTLVPNATDVDHWSGVFRSPGDPDTFVLFGSLNQKATAQGALWFLHTIWPGFARAHPAARLVVAGRSPGKELRKLANSTPNVDLVENPIDLREPVAQAGTIVVPQIWGTGSKLKVYEAIASGRRIVASESATVGLPSDLEAHIDIASTTGAWHRLMETAARNPRSEQNQNQLGDILTASASWTASQALLVAAIETVVSR